jgi:ATP-binding cassette subfamily B protein
MVIAHRMRTVSGADKIVVLSDGVVKESGKPAELMQKNGIFAKMVKTQTEDQKWAFS